MRLFEGTQFDIPPRCDRCGLLVAECKCPPEPTPRVPPEKQTLRLLVEKRKKGKLVTVVRGLAIDGALPELLTKLKTACGAGVTLKDDELEIQGEHLERVREQLTKLGYRVQK